MRFKKTKTTIVLTIILIMLTIISTPTNVQAATVPEYIKVGLRYGTSAVTAGTISSTTGLILGTLTGNEFTQTVDLSSMNAVTLTVENGKIVVKDAGGVQVADIGTDATYMLNPVNYQNAWPIGFNGINFRGGMIVKLINGKINIINYVKLEEYLKGVLHSEMPQSSPLESLKAQAVAARNFTIVKQQNHSVDGFNLCATTHCQMYTGVVAEYDSTNQAVDATKGVFMYAGGNIVEAYYSKNSGGFTNNSEDVWTTALAYLRSGLDTNSPDYNWTATFSLSDVKAKVEAAGFTVGTVQSVKVKSRTAYGLVKELEIVGSGGTAVLSKEKIRSAFGATVVKSLKFGFGGTGSNTEVSVPSASAISANATSLVSGEVHVLGADGTKSKVDAGYLYGYDGINVGKVLTGTTATKITTGGADEADLSGGNLLFTGKGYGHGVGMSQDGAIEMGKSGITFDEILKYYYKDVEVR